MNVPSRLGRSFAGLSIVGLMGAGFIHLPTSNSQQVDRTIGQSPRFDRASGASRLATGQSPRLAIGQSPRLANELPLVSPIVSSDPTPARTDLSTTAGVAVQEKPPVRLNSTQIALNEAKVAVSLSQAQLAQARINLSEFQANHDSAKILSAQGKVSRQQAALAIAAYKLAQLQHRSAAIGLQESQAQLIAARSKASRLGCKLNSVAEM